MFKLAQTFIMLKCCIRMLLFNISVVGLLTVCLAMFSLEIAQELAAATSVLFPSTPVSFSWNQQATVPCSDTILEIAKPTSEKIGLSVTAPMLFEDESPQSSKCVAAVCLLMLLIPSWIFCFCVKGVLQTLTYLFL